MKVNSIKNLLLSCIITFTIISCDIEKLIETDEFEETTIANSNCSEPIKIVELQVENSQGNLFYKDYTFNSIKADNSNIEITATLEGYYFNAKVVDFSLKEGGQTLDEVPYGKTVERGFTFTTYYENNGNSPNYSNPTGEFYINTINNTCNTISGSIYINAYHFDIISGGGGSGLGQIRSTIRVEFENVPLDNETHQL